MKRWLRWLPPLDLVRLRRMRLLPLAAMALLMAVGVAFVYSANAVRESDRLRQLYLEHAELGAIGLAACVALAYLDYRRLLRWSWLFYALSLGLLVAVLLVGSDRGMGARRWVFNIQPSEFAKLATIMLLAQLLGRARARRGPWDFLLAAAVVALPTALILKQPDLGTALVFGPILLAVLFAAGVAPRLLLAALLAGVLAVGLVLGAIVVQERPGAPAWAKRGANVATGFMGDFQRRRLLDYLYPERDPYNLGWNRRQSEIAIGSGGRWGKGYLRGDQNLLGYLPQQVSANDFIFAVLAEEMGFAGSMCVLLLYAGMVFSGLRAAAVCQGERGRLLGVGIVTLIFSHVFINIAMTVGLLPITGLPLPFISYGRTFMLTVAMAIGLLQSVAVHGRQPQGAGAP